MPADKSRDIELIVRKSLRENGIGLSAKARKKLPVIIDTGDAFVLARSQAKHVNAKHIAVNSNRKLTNQQIGQPVRLRRRKKQQLVYRETVEVK